MLLCVQRRLDKGNVGRYEASLSICTLRHLFVDLRTGNSLVPEPEIMWARMLQDRLEAILDGKQDNSASEDWMQFWMAYRSADRVLSTRIAGMLLRDAPEGSIDEIHSLQDESRASKDSGQVSRGYDTPNAAPVPETREGSVYDV